MSDNKKENLFANLAAATATTAVKSRGGGDRNAGGYPPLPCPGGAAEAKTIAGKKKPEPVNGKRDNPDYCQANCLRPKKLRRAVDKALLDIEGLDYSTLVEDLLRKWLKSRGVAE